MKDEDIVAHIKRCRYRLLIHSCVYYQLNDNVVSDGQWDEWAKELVALQNKYPKLAEQAPLHQEFLGWDGSTGYHLPTSESWVIEIAKRQLKYRDERLKNDRK